MSYILDALKRAETERNGACAPRSPLPSSFIPAAVPRGGSRTPWLIGTSAVLAGLLAATLGGVWLARAPGKAPVQSVQANVETTPATPAPAKDEGTRHDQVHDPQPRAQKPLVASGPPLALHTQAPPGKAPALGTLRDLPEHIQREIPPLVIGGYLYSATRSDRTVLINNRLLREGDLVAPGLTLESLLAHGMVLDYRGYRYRSTY